MTEVGSGTQTVAHLLKWCNAAQKRFITKKTLTDFVIKLNTWRSSTNDRVEHARMHNCTTIVLDDLLFLFHACVRLNYYILDK